MVGRAHSDGLPFSGFGTAAALREVAEALPEAVLTTDLAGDVTYWSPAAERLTGWSRAEVLGRSCAAFGGEGAAGRCEPPRVCTLRAKDGRELLVVKRAAPLHDSEGELTGSLEIFAEALVQGSPVPAREAELDGDFFGLVGDHPAMRALFEALVAAARTDAPVAILGERGAGKRLCAQALHALSPRAHGPFVRVPCAALGESRLGSDLFAATGGGTLLLEEIGDLPQGAQGKLLRALEERRVGARLVCSTERDLRQLVAGGRFRASLLFRLSAFAVEVPPLREHIADLPRIARRLLVGANEPGARLSQGALDALSAYAWPGNVRELRSALEYAAGRASGEEIRPEHLPAGQRRAGGEELPPRNDERAALLAVLSRHGWNRAATARELGVSRVTLWKRMKKLGVATPAK